MAKYSNAYKKRKQKKRKQNNYIVYLVIAVIVIFGFIFLMAKINEKSTNNGDVTYSYSDFNHIDNAVNITTQSEEKYLVYYYGDYCDHCSHIKQDVLSFAYSNDNDITVYLFNSRNEITDNNQIDSTEGTPTLYVVIDGVIQDEFIGSDDIPDILNDINNNAYNKLN